MKVTRKNIPTVGILGLGVMGTALAKRLQDKGYALCLYNRTISKARNVASRNDVVCITPSDVAKRSDILISCVRDDEASQEVWFGRDGAIHAVKKGAVCLESATLSVSYIRTWSSRLSRARISHIEMPVTGSKHGARTGTLTLFFAESGRTKKSTITFLRDISSHYFRFTRIGDPTCFKLIYNMLGANILVSFAEALSMSDSFGLSRKKTLDIMLSNPQGWGQSVAKSKGRSMHRASYTDVQCAVATLNKDVSYLAHALDMSSYALSRASRSHIAQCVEIGLGEKDMAAVFEFYRKR